MNEYLKKIKGFLAYECGFLEKRFYFKTRKYLSKYYNKQNDIRITERKTLIYMLDGRAYSGGISDVIKGILSIYKYSKENGYIFKINFCYPYHLCEYLDSNIYNWKIAESEINYNSNVSAPFWMYSVYTKYGKSLEFESHYQQQLLKKFIKKNESKNQFHIYTNSEWASETEYSLLFNELFKPSVQLDKLLKLHVSRLKNEYISMTFRFQQLLGDFENKSSYLEGIKPYLEDIKNKNFSCQAEQQLRALLGDFKNKKISVPITDETEKNILIDNCINKISEIHSNSYPDLKILITADSEVFLKKVSKLDFVYVVSANNIFEGIDNLSKDFKMFAKPFVDTLMLANANKLFLLCKSPMYRSAFAKSASYINNAEYSEIIF